MAYPGFSESFRSARTRATVATTFVALVGVVSLISVVHFYDGYSIIDRARAGTLSQADAIAFDDTTAVVAGLYVLTFFPAAIAFLAWLSRSVDNIPHLTGRLPRVTPRWSIGWWFVPFANLFKPYVVVRELSEHVSPADRPHGGGLILSW